MVDAINAVNDATASTPHSVSGTASLGKDDFLRLLVAQLEHQDPFTPMDNQAFVAQLAEFSTLEQMQNIEATLEEAMQADRLLSQSLSNSLVTTLIGKEVKVQGERFHLEEGTMPELGYSLPSSAREVTVEIRDEQGNLIRTLQLGAQSAGAKKVEWDGKGRDGTSAPSGNYSFHVRALDSDGKLIETVSFIRGLITGVRYAAGNAVLLMGPFEVPLPDVMEILKP